MSMSQAEEEEIQPSLDVTKNEEKEEGNNEEIQEGEPEENNDEEPILDEKEHMKKVLKERIVEWLVGYKEEMWTAEFKHVCSEFLFKEERESLYVWLEPRNETLELKTSLLEPPPSRLTFNDQEFVAVIKTTDTTEKITEDNFDRFIYINLINTGDNMNSLLRKITSENLPNFLRDDQWPSNIKKDFLETSHKFLSDLTDTISRREGKIKLYIPQENFDADLSPQDHKDMVHRLESAVINWNRQIKELLNVQFNQTDSDNQGPIDEINQWKKRMENLKNVEDQLDKRDLQKILDILKESGSSYLRGFNDICEDIKSGALEAEDNLKYLIKLQDPCEKMQEVSPLEIKNIVPKLLHCVRLIWEYSHYYNTEEKIVGLLRKISNEIIKKCRHHINLDDMLHGDVEKCMVDLNECIESGKQWKRVYEKYAKMVNSANSEKEWSFKSESIFAEIDAFVQRCYDLIEICEGQIQFARKGRKIDLPKFSGSRGPEIIAVLEEIKDNFNKYLEGIKGSDQNKILDIKSTKWHDDYNDFKAGMKNLDNRYINLINFSFENINTLKQATQYLEAFDDLSKRKTIQSHVHKQIDKINDIFSKELKVAEEAANSKFKIDHPLIMGEYSGKALWIKSILKRLEKMKSDYNNLIFIKDEYKRDILDEYNQTYSNLRGNMIGQHIKFKEQVESFEDEAKVKEKFNEKILKRDSDKSSAPDGVKITTLGDSPEHLKSNFPEDLQKMIVEVFAFQKLEKEGGINKVNQATVDLLLEKRESLRVSRESVMSAIRSHNKVIDSMNKFEKKLFKKHIEKYSVLKERGRGSNKWSVTFENFVKSFKMVSKEVYSILMEFKQNNWLIKKECNKISNLRLIVFDQKEPVELHDFEKKQKTNLDAVSSNLKQILKEIKDKLEKSYKNFQDLPQQRGHEIQKEYFHHVRKIDKIIKDQLIKAYTKSFKDFLVAVAGDKKTDSNPVQLFKVSIKIEEKKNEFELMFQPDPENLKTSITTLETTATYILNNIRRMFNEMLDIRTKAVVKINQEYEAVSEIQLKNDKFDEMEQTNEFLKDEKKENKSFKEIIAGKISDTCKEICKELGEQKGRLNEYLTPWKNERTRKVWSQAKDQYFDHVLKTMKVSSFREQVEFYDNVNNEIRIEKPKDETICIYVDTENIKIEIEKLIKEAQEKQLNKIRDAAVNELNSLYNKFDSAKKEMEPEPNSLQDLKRVQDKWKQLYDEKDKTFAKISPLEDVFKLLDDYSVLDDGDEKTKRTYLRDKFDNFCKMLDEIEIRNETTSVRKKKEHSAKIEEYTREVKENKENFEKTCPKNTGKLEYNEAIDLIEGFKKQTEEFREKYKKMQFGLDLFVINYSPPAQLAQVEDKIEDLKIAWDKKEEWNKHWNELKQIKFRDIDWEQIQEICQKYLSEIKTWADHMQSWGVVKDLYQEIDLLRINMPVVEILRKNSIRDRHWDEVKGLVNDQFDQNGNYFTLEKIYDLNLNKFCDQINDLWEISEQQYKIEACLSEIKTRWAEEILDTQRLKTDQDIFIIHTKSAEKINEKLENDMLELTTKKSNVHAEEFIGEIEEWEHYLNTMIETLDILMVVQRKFTYFNNIFINLKDRVTQMPGDFNDFKEIKNNFKAHLDRISSTQNSKIALTVDHLKGKFREMNEGLEIIQRKMKNYLKQRKSKFPRFYFLSDEDMFEMLGKAKFPNIINKHLKKMFEGIKRLEYEETNEQRNTGDKNAKMYKFTQMQSQDGEAIDFKGPLVDGELINMMEGIEDGMKSVLKDKLIESDSKLTKMSDANSLKSNDANFSNWIKSTPGQILITSVQINWTQKCGDTIKASTNVQKNEKADSKEGKARRNHIRDKWKTITKYFEDFIKLLPNLLKGSASKNLKKKVVALIIIQVYHRSILENLEKNCKSYGSFEWKKYLRFYKPEASGDKLKVKIQQGNAVFYHGWEYQGNNGRLVITPLTDRCYLTLTTAMNLKRGGSPQGPAGTGKTETVKDLGKNMGRFVFIFNCSEGLDVVNLKNMFEGLARTGSWGCFDEFNRIEIEVLSVIAIQISSILDGLAKIQYSEEDEDTAKGECILDEANVELNMNCSIFITMNPGYGGRNPLPDNLKALFRPFAMMKPDVQIICEIILKSQGFLDAKDLSERIKTLYELMNQQMSKQDHYDFNLRAIISVLNLAGRIKNEQDAANEKKKNEISPEKDKEDETKIIIKAIRDMNDPKLVAEDIPLFSGLLKDLFPGNTIESKKNRDLSMKIHYTFFEHNLDNKDYSVNKILQLYDSRLTRHGNMLVGDTMSGKTTTYTMLAEAMNKLHKEQPNKYPEVDIYTLNPKSITFQELYGYYNAEIEQTEIGVFSYLMDQLCNKDETPNEKWIVFDGPIDTKWVESMNSLLDDNRVLTLLDGNRINLHPLVSLLFEVRDLVGASPATVSRCGMIYLDVNKLDWDSVRLKWLLQKEKDGFEYDSLDQLEELFDKWVEPIMQKKREGVLWDVIPLEENALIESLCKMIDAVTIPEHKLVFAQRFEDDLFWTKYEKWFIYAVIWTLGASLHTDCRKAFDNLMREIEDTFPPSQTVYDCFYNVEKNDFMKWEDKFSNSPIENWAPYNKNIPDHRFLVETVDTHRSRKLVTLALQSNIKMLLIGTTGTGKTSLIKSILEQLGEKFTYNIVNLSANTSSTKLQQIVQSKLFRPGKKVFQPPGGKNSVLFIDDLNMPKINEFRSQPPLELLRQYIEYGGWYDRAALDQFVWIKKTDLLCAMGPPAGGRNVISKRLTSKFHILNLTMPSRGQIKRVFSSILHFKLGEGKFDAEDIIANIGKCVEVIIDMYNVVHTSFKPTPQKFHYMFNMRDMSRVVQGITHVDRDNCESTETFLRLLIHENFRVFRDRMVNNEDRNQLKRKLNDLLSIHFQRSIGEILGELEEQDLTHDLIFTNFVEDGNAYAEVTDHQKLKETLEEKMEEMASRSKKNEMDIVFFQDAIRNCCKINRIISLSNGHGLLIGEGGSGRHSLTKIAAFLAGYRIYQIQITKNFSSKQFKTSMKELFERIALKKIPTVFIFSDNEITGEAIIEDVNNILSLGEIPNLYQKKEGKDEFESVREQLRTRNTQKRESDEELYDKFLTLIQGNLHIVFCMSQTGPNLRTYGRQYPGLINNTTQIWFDDWPREALIQVSKKYLKGKLTAELPEKDEDMDDDDEEAKKVEQYSDGEEEVDPEVEQKRIQDILDRIIEEKTEAISQYFGNVHTAVIETAKLMKLKLRRTLYVTPKNFIDFVKEFNQSLEAQNSEMHRQILKYDNGLKRLKEAQTTCADLSQKIKLKRIESTKKKEKLNELDKELNKKSKNFEIENREMMEKNAKIKEETETAEYLKRVADEEKAKMQPILDEALQKVEELKNNKSAFAEFLAGAKKKLPFVMVVLRAIMVLMGKSKSDSSIMATITKNFVGQLNSIDLEAIDRKRFDKFEKESEKIPTDLSKKSQAAEIMRQYIQSIARYIKALQDIQPTLKKVRELEERVANLNKELEMLNTRLKKTQSENKKLQEKQKVNKAALIKAEAELKTLENELDIASNLVKNLEHSQESWKKKLINYQEEIKKIEGNVMMSAAFLNYLGPFPSDYRDMLLQNIKKFTLESGIKHSPDWSFVNFLGKEIDILNWTFKGLPSDNFSKENGVIVMNSKRWPLMIDPQSQANKWIKGLYGKNVIVVDSNNVKFMEKIKNSMTHGFITLMENVDENIDPALDPILNKNIRTVDGKTFILFGDSQFAYNEDFKLFITTRIKSPVYQPEVSTKVSLVNFAVKEKGLEEQLLEVLLKIMNKKLENTRVECIKSKAQCETELVELENKILVRLSSTETELVKDVELNKILETSKDTEEKANQTIQSNQNTLKKNTLARENYRPLGMIGSLLYFTIYSLENIDHMYQFSLDSYVQLFKTVVEENKEAKSGFGGSGEVIKEKIEVIDKELRKRVYDFACQGIFEKDKLLLSLILAVALAPIDEKNRKEKEEREDKSKMRKFRRRNRKKKEEESRDEDDDQNEDYYQKYFPDEWKFFLKGGVVVNREKQLNNPDPNWITKAMWDNVTELEKLHTFSGITGSFMHSTKEWKRYFTLERPENGELPSDWGTKIKGFSVLVLLRAIRQDRLMFATRKFVRKTLGEKFIQPPVFNINSIYEQSTHKTPVLFILSQGSNPWTYLESLGEQHNKKITQISLGQGQATRALDSIKNALKEGHWVYLANIHLSRNFLKDLEKRIEKMSLSTKSNKQQFRLFLSAVPDITFPISILQNCLKVTTEPPTGLKKNMLKIYKNIIQDRLEEAPSDMTKYKKLLFGLTWFHSLVIERKRFKDLGWNVMYDFNDSDFMFSEKFIRTIVDPQSGKNSSSVQWDAIQYIISEINYGGRLTDPRDRRLLVQYCKEIFVEPLLNSEGGFVLSEYKIETEYKVPKDLTDEDPAMKLRNMPSQNDSMMQRVKEFYINFIDESFPDFEVPGVFGQHGNAEINSQRDDARVLLDSILSLQPKDVASEGGKSREDQVRELVTELFDQVPEEIDYNEAVRKNISRGVDIRPMTIVLLQEISRYNVIIRLVRKSFKELIAALTGQTLVSEKIEILIQNFYENKVPAIWKDCYHSMKSLSNWISDLEKRIEFFKNWAFVQKPVIFWLGGFTFPTGFTTALKQEYSRSKEIPIHNLKWDFSFTRSEVTQSPTEGAYVNGIYLQGARWNEDDVIEDERQMTLFDNLPTVCMKPTPNKSRVSNKGNTYNCPIYVFPTRYGTRERPSYLFDIRLPMSPEYNEAFFIKRATACLLSLAD